MTEPVILVSPLLAHVGNLTIVVGTKLDAEPKTFFVNVECLRLASPVWNNMLKPEGHFLENGSKEVHFTHDDPDAFEILLQIVHHQTSSLPENLSLLVLSELACLTDKYDMLPKVIPLIPRWISVLDDNISSGNQQVRRLFVAWTFGLQEHFTNAVTELIISTRTLRNGELKWEDFYDETIQEQYLPVDVKDFICAQSKKKRSALGSLGPSLVKELLTGRYCRSTRMTKRTECRHIMTGSLMQHLHRVGVWPDGAPDTWASLTVGSCARELRRGLSITSLNKHHNQCAEGLGWNTLIENVVNKKPALLDSHLKHFTKFVPTSKPRNVDAGKTPRKRMRL